MSKPSDATPVGIQTSELRDPWSKSGETDIENKAILEGVISFGSAPVLEP